MTSSNLMGFILALFFITVGGVALMIPWVDPLQTALILLLLENSVAISLFGFALLVIGMIVLVNIGLHAKRRHYYIRSGMNAIVVDETLIKQYLTVYWKQLFPDSDIPSSLYIKKNKIHISVDFPYLPMEEQKILLERVRKDLRAAFAKVLDYQEEFYLSASFQPKPQHHS